MKPEGGSVCPPTPDPSAAPLAIRSTPATAVAESAALDGVSVIGKCGR